MGKCRHTHTHQYHRHFECLGLVHNSWTRQLTLRSFSHDMLACKTVHLDPPESWLPSPGTYSIGCLRDGEYMTTF